MIAHDTLTQLKYQYSEKALKYSALNEDELLEAHEKYGDAASESLAWQGKRPADVLLRILGRITKQLDETGGWRAKWKKAGLTDNSWNEFLKRYARTAAESQPFIDDRYLREEEIANLVSLCTAIDEELFERLDQVRSARASLKTKWWKQAHIPFSRALANLVYDKLELPNTPDKAAYTKEWTDYIKSQLRIMVGNWRESPVWKGGTAANNEADIDKALEDGDFTESALRKKP